MRSAVEDFFFEDQDESFSHIPQESKHCNTDEEDSMWNAGETVLKNKQYLLKFDHCNCITV